VIYGNMHCKYLQEQYRILNQASELYLLLKNNAG